MKWEYRQLHVGVRGMLSPKLPDSLIPELNELGKEGWEVDQVIELQVGIAGTSAVVFILRRELP